MQTRNVWLAAFLLAHGLRFIRAERLVGSAPRCVFEFDDPDGRAPLLTRRFHNDLLVQRIIDARRVLGDVAEITSTRGAAERADVAERLAALDTRWRAHPS